jgi:citrate synthase
MQGSGAIVEATDDDEEEPVTATTWPMPPAGLDGVPVAATAIGDVRGDEGFYHYRQYSAVDLAARRSLEDVWQLLLDGELPDRAAAEAFRAHVASLRAIPAGTRAVLEVVAPTASPLDALRTALSALGADLGLRPWQDHDPSELRDQSLHLCAALPGLVAAIHRLRHGLPVLDPDPDLGHVADYLRMLTGALPDPAIARALEQYLITTVDHGFNSSTFTARVIASTGADLGAALTGALGALSGPLHGGAPSRVLDLLDEVASPDGAAEAVRRKIGRGERIMGFGHRVYRTEDPRAQLLRGIARTLGGERVELAIRVEEVVVEALAELKPGRHLYANVEFYAGVLLERCGLPADLFTPTFATSRAIGWTAHVLEQVQDNRIIRPSASYVGPPPPQPVPDAG